MTTGSQALSLNSKILFQARLARRAARRAGQALRFGSLSSSPVFFANSFPKSGTHLLTQVMHGFARIGPAVDSGLPAVVTFDGLTGRQRSAAEILGDLRRFLPGDIGYGHLHATPEILASLCRDGLAPYFILRDPRDVAVSHVHYVTEMKPDHILHRYYQEHLRSFDELLSASIQGVTDKELGIEMGEPTQASLPDIRWRFEPFLGWLDRPEVLVLRYEDFISGRGQALERVLEHALERGFQLSVPRTSALQVLEQSIDPQRSPTFRSGKIGGWQAAFKEDHKQAFKDITGDLLLLLGYESGSDW
jgi:hypothetical protein